MILHRINKLKTNLSFHLVLLAAICGVFFVANMPIGVWFTGWDNLHPEFNFALNIKRALSAVWQTNQGLGTYGGHGYAATLLHSVFLYLMSFILPLSALRSFFTFLMLFVGVFGVFFMTREVIGMRSLDSPPAGGCSSLGMTEGGEDTRNKAALFAGLFYMLNLGTLQNFYVQLEAFTIHFAALPWLFLTLTHFLKRPSRKNLGFFVAVSIAATGQGFIPPLFFVYMLLLGAYVMIYCLYKRNVSSLKKSSLIIILTLIINAYWFLPVVYYSFTNSSAYLHAYNNISSTDDFISKNKVYGTIKNVALIKGFIIEVTDTTEIANNYPIFSLWHKHFTNPLFNIIGYGFFAIALLGMVTSLLERNKWKTCAFALGFLVTFSLLATSTPPFSYLTVLMQHIPILKQAFRIAFTKFSISFSFFYAIMFGIGISSLLKGVTRLGGLPTTHNEVSIGGKESRGRTPLGMILQTVSILFLLSALLFFALPSFTGNFLYPHATVKIPSTYFDLYAYLKTQPKEDRIANMPQGWNWGWSVYKWGYSGSGFLWYGIEQPIMDRSFDVWGTQNENYYWEISHALFAKNYELFDSILIKYNVKWVLFDQNSIPYPQAKAFIYADDLQKHLTGSGRYTLTKTFDEPNDNAQPIMLYRVRTDVTTPRLVDVTHIKNIGPESLFSNYDAAYQENGIYRTDPSIPYDVFYPFRSFSTSRTSTIAPFTISTTLTDTIYTASTPLEVLNGKAQAPSSDKDRSIRVDANTETQTVSVSVPLSEYPKLYNNKNDSSFYERKPQSCGLKGGTFTQKVIADQYVRFTSVKSDNCYDIILPQLAHQNGYLISVKSRHIMGKSLAFAVINTSSKKADIEVPLPTSDSFTTSYFVLAPSQVDGMGYNLHFGNTSITSDETINDLDEVTVRTLPYHYLAHLNFKRPSLSKTDDTSLYIADSAYNVGWKAYVVGGSSVESASWRRGWIDAYFPFLFGKELKQHVLVNGWANGWVLESASWRRGSRVEGGKSNIVIIFWPQYLQWIGFGLLFISLVVILLV